ncbi:oxidoreductase [Epithele typhae]|uniref:oxidoreductase n=1 Tax=Epithele typhae TaxID=378194 RepID=UPI002008CA9F|nr:oxidoreductase [Epithele typhae]KAH9941189.1 oxidoreductase [Epithele typhae]
MSMTKRIRIYTEEDVSRHNNASSCWVTRNGKVYNVTSFIVDHPGGDDLILNYAGKDIGVIMKDPEEHDHSESAYNMLEEFVVGRIGVGETLVSDGTVSIMVWEATDDFHPEETDLTADYEKNEFLDLRRPLFMQVWRANFSKSYYLKQVHQPRHLVESPRLFGPWYLEIFTRTAWYVVPTIWLPITLYLFIRSLVQFSQGAYSLPPFTVDPSAPIKAMLAGRIDPWVFAYAMPSFFLGNLAWTLLEYIFHRFLFHIDGLLPDTQAALTFHFLLHGIHHYLPMDRLRLVMPPVMFSALSFPMTRLAHLIFPTAMANSVIAGAFTFYVLYDCMHYAYPPSQPSSSYIRDMKKYHLAHHYKNFDLGFGVTSKIWDYVFNTVLTL